MTSGDTYNHFAEKEEMNEEFGRYSHDDSKNDEHTEEKAETPVFGANDENAVNEGEACNEGQDDEDENDGDESFEVGSDDSFIANVNCMVCTLTHDEETILLCDNCNKGTHMACCVPPMTELPPEEEIWYCAECTRLAEDLKSPRAEEAIGRDGRSQLLRAGEDFHHQTSTSLDALFDSTRKRMDHPPPFWSASGDDLNEANEPRKGGKHQLQQQHHQYSNELNKRISRLLDVAVKHVGNHFKRSSQVMDRRYAQRKKLMTVQIASARSLSTSGLTENRKRSLAIELVNKFRAEKSLRKSSKKRK